MLAVTASRAGNENLCPLVECFDASKKKKKKGIEEKSLFSSTLYQDNCRGNCYARQNFHAENFYPQTVNTEVLAICM